MRDRPSELPIRFDAIAYRVGRIAILRGITLDICPGEPMLLLGPNGSGKTTLLKVAMELLTPSAGRLSFAGRSKGVGSRRAIVFQKPVMLRRSVAAYVSLSFGSDGVSAETGVVIHLM